jgi:hypothetical protein
VRVRQLIGPPIEAEMLEALAEPGEDADDKRFLNRCHERVIEALQDLIDRANSGRPVPERWSAGAFGSRTRRAAARPRTRRRITGSRIERVR